MNTYLGRPFLSVLLDSVLFSSVKPFEVGHYYNQLTNRENLDPKRLNYPLRVTQLVSSRARCEPS